MPVPTETKAKVDDVAAVAVVALGDRRGVDVVLDHRLCAEETPEVAQHRRPLPPRQVRGQLESAAVGLDDSRAADHRLQQRSVAVDARVLQEVVSRARPARAPGPRRSRTGRPGSGGRERSRRGR